MQPPSTWTGAAGNSNWFTTNNWNPADDYPQAGDTATITNGVVLLTNSTFALAGFTLTNATMVFSNWTTALTASNVTLWNRGTVTVANAFSNSPDMSNRVWIVCTNLLVAAGGAIDVSRKGYAKGTNSGAGCGPGGGHDVPVWFLRRRRRRPNRHLEDASDGCPGCPGLDHKCQWRRRHQQQWRSRIHRYRRYPAGHGLHNPLKQAIRFDFPLASARDFITLCR
jgi:hypothetical protein